MPDYDIADPNDPRTLIVPFVFVPHGHPPPTEWMRDHPGWVRFPATFVPRDTAADEIGPQRDMPVDFPDASAAADVSPMAADQSVGAAEDRPPAYARTGKNRPPPVGTFSDTTAFEFAAWHDAQATFSHPMDVAGLRRVGDDLSAQAGGSGRSYADYANMVLGIGSAHTAEPKPAGESDATRANGSPTSHKTAAPPLSQQEVTSKLQDYTNQARVEVEDNPFAGLTPDEGYAVINNPKLYPMFRGKAIDRLVRDSVRKDPLLKDRITGKPTYGPDFIDQLTGQTYDMTTKQQFPAHQARPGYGDNLIHLNTGSASPFEIPVELPRIEFPF